MEMLEMMDATNGSNDSSILTDLYQGWPLCNISTSSSNVSSPVVSGDVGSRFNFQLFDFTISLVLLILVALPGLVGNFISVFILSRPQMRTSLNKILIGLASFDSILLITSILLFVLPSIYAYCDECDVCEFYYRHVHPFITPYTFVLGMTAQTSSVYLTVAVTTERYIAVCHPLKARSWNTCKRARTAVIIIGLFALCYNLPRFFEVERCLYIDRELNEAWFMVMPSSLRSNQTYITWYIVSLYFVVMIFVPFTLLAILNGAIYKQVRQANRQRSLLTKSQKREIGLATMLLCVVAVFFISNILAIVVNIFETINILKAATIFEVDEMTRVSNLLVSINSSVNFIIYCIFGDKFKRLFLRYFCCCFRLRRRQPSDTPEVSISMGNNTLQPADVLRVSSLFSARTTSPSGPNATSSGRVRTSLSRVPMQQFLRSNRGSNGAVGVSNGCSRPYGSTGSAGIAGQSCNSLPSSFFSNSSLASSQSKIYRTSYGGGAHRNQLYDSSPPFTRCSSRERI